MSICVPSISSMCPFANARYLEKLSLVELKECDDPYAKISQSKVVDYYVQLDKHGLEPDFHLP